jgi:hypothetical protein
VIKVKIDSTSGKYDIDGIKDFENLQNAIWYCWKISDGSNVIVHKPSNWDHELKKEIKPNYDFDLEIYDHYRE